MRPRVKQLCETVLGNRAVASMICQVMRRDVVLAYHNVVPDEHPGEGDRSLHLPLARFIAQIEWLESVFRVVSVSEIVSEPPSGTGPRAAITFDDSYDGAVRYALPLLSQKQLPATVFVCSTWEGGETMWWDSLSDPRIGAVPPTERDRALSSALGRRDQALESAEAHNVPVRLMSPPYRIASVADLRVAIDSGPFTVGSHTRTHANLLAVNDLDLRDELSGSRDELESAWGDRAIPWLAYPYGLTSERVVEAVQAAGYEGAFLISGGVLHRPVRAMHMLPRINVPASMTLAGLRLRVAGLL